VPHLPVPQDTPLLAEGDTTLSPVTLPAYLSRLFGATTFLEMSQGKGVGAQTTASSGSPYKSDCCCATEQILDPQQDPQQVRHGTMALNTQIRAACLLILLISSLTSGTILQQRVRAQGPGS
jgi:hypothetical protein